MKRDFDTLAKTWDENPGRVRLAQAIAQAMVENLQLRGDETLLDYGAGTGLVTVALSPFVKRVIAADSSQGMLDVLARKVQASGLSTIETLFVDLDASKTGIPKVDVVVSSMTLHHVRDVGRLARNFRDMLLPGGQVAVADLETEAGDFHDDPTGVEHFGFSRPALEEHFMSAGFSSVATRVAYTMEKEKANGVRKHYPILLLTGKRWS